MSDEPDEPDEADEPDPPGDAPGSGPELNPSDGRPAAARRRRRAVLVAAAVVVVWLVAAGWMLRSASADAERGIDAMEQVRASSSGNLAAFVDSVGDPGSAEVERVDADLATATGAFRSAHDAAASPLLAPMRVLPVIGRQIRSVAALSDAAATTTASARERFAELSDIAATSPRTPRERIAAGESTAAVLERFSADLDGLDLGPDEGLVGPLAESRQRFAAEQAELLDTLTRARASVAGVNSFLTGPTRYLVLAANNAEMRAGSGMYLQAGELTVEEGRFDLSPLEPTARMVLDAPGTTLDADMAGLWDWLKPDREWRNLNLSPRFDESARMASEMWAASGHAPVDGVIVVDVVGLRKLLQLTGPVEVTDPDGTTSTVSAKGVVNDLLLRQYIEFSDDKADRRDRLSSVGQAVFSALTDRPYSPGELLRVLQSAGGGRHLMMWSSDPVQQAGWEALGITGPLEQDSMMLSVLNRGGNKLDQFLDVDADMTWVRRGDRNHVTVAVTLRNDAPEGLPLYVEGPFPGLDAQAGEYVGLAALTVPKTATSPTTTGQRMILSGEDGPTRVLVAEVRVLRGATGSVTFEFDLPAEQPTVRVEASARIPATTWTAGPADSADPDSWTDDVPHTVALNGARRD